MEEKIAAWLTYQPRTRLVFVNHKHRGIPFVDFGYDFAKAIEPKLNSPMLPMESENCARKIFKSNTHKSEIIGNYVAIENWAILMEPALKIDFVALLSSISQNTTVILLLDETIKDNSLHGIDLKSIQYYLPD
ncbi:MAG: hypothetical protein NC453_22475 [Muribaculum sp.]|nr:hypothetical protein [Muribaculum sp.]